MTPARFVIDKTCCASHLTGLARRQRAFIFAAWILLAMSMGGQDRGVTGGAGVTSETLLMLSVMGEHYLVEKKPAMARDLWARVLSTQKDTPGENHPQLAYTTELGAQAYVATGEKGKVLRRNSKFEALQAEIEAFSLK
jgi:hypothetical protein